MSLNNINLDRQMSKADVKKLTKMIEMWDEERAKSNASVLTNKQRLSALEMAITRLVNELKETQKLNKILWLSLLAISATITAFSVINMLH